MQPQTKRKLKMSTTLLTACIMIGSLTNPATGSPIDKPAVIGVRQTRDTHGGGIQNAPKFLEIFDELKQTAIKFQEADLADIDLKHASGQLLEEEALASLMKAVQATIEHAPVRARVAAEQLIASEIKQVAKDIKLQQSGAAEAKAEQEIADEIHKVEDKIRTGNSDGKETDDDKTESDAVQTDDAKKAELREESVIASEIHGVEDEIQTRLTGIGNLAQEEMIASQIKSVAKAIDAGENFPATTPASEATQEATKESVIGGIIHNVAGLFSSGDAGTTDAASDDSTATDNSEETQSAPLKDSSEETNDDDDDSDEDDDDDDDFYGDAFASDDDDDDPLRNPKLTHLDSSASDDSYYDSPADDPGRSSASSTDVKQEAAPPGGETWHITAMTAIMCAVIGFVMLGVVLIWYRRLGHRGGLPGAGQLVIEDDEDAVYSATTQPEATQLGRYSKLQ